MRPSSSQVASSTVMPARLAASSTVSRRRSRTAASGECWLGTDVRVRAGSVRAGSITSLFALRATEPARKIGRVVDVAWGAEVVAGNQNGVEPARTLARNRRPRVTSEQNRVAAHPVVCGCDDRSGAFAPGLDDAVDGLRVQVRPVREDDDRGGCVIGQGGEPAAQGGAWPFGPFRAVDRPGRGNQGVGADDDDDLVHRPRRRQSRPDRLEQQPLLRRPETYRGAGRKHDSDDHEDMIAAGPTGRLDRTCGVLHQGGQKLENQSNVDAARGSDARCRVRGVRVTLRGESGGGGVLRSLPDAPVAHNARIRQLCRLAVAENFTAIGADAESVGRILAMTPTKARTGPHQLVVDRGRGELQAIPLSAVAAVDLLDRVVVLTSSYGSTDRAPRGVKHLRLVTD